MTKWVRLQNVLKQQQRNKKNNRGPEKLWKKKKVCLNCWSEKVSCQGDRWNLGQGISTLRAVKTARQGRVYSETYHTALNIVSLNTNSSIRPSYLKGSTACAILPISLLRLNLEAHSHSCGSVTERREGEELASCLD